MLKKFFLNFLSSFAATWLALGLFGIVAVIVAVGLIAKMGVSAAGNENVSINKHSVLVLDLGTIIEREMPEDIDIMAMVQGQGEAPQTLASLTTAIREAADSKVKMIYLKCGNTSAAPATLHALRNELQAFRQSGKKIYAYADQMTTAGYYLASVADSVFINANGSIDLKGLVSESLYFKNLLDKLGIQMQVVKVGTFKSAVEPYISNEMSQPARAQLDTLFGNIWQCLATEIETSRKLDNGTINRLVNNSCIPLQDGLFDKKVRLVDAAVYERTMDSRIADAINTDKKKLNYITPAAMLSQTDWGLEYGSKKQIAVLYATGEIMEGTKKGINCEVLVPLITQLADDDNIKGMVLRVNSPGGSVFGSEQIAEALAYFQAQKKPLAVSMGDYAASGGYWISCHADRIFADPLTITGSIGIFGLIPNVSGLAEKIGVTPQKVATNPQAAFPDFFQPMTPEQQAQMQKFIEQGYDKFIRRVATGRKMKQSKVRTIAEGRVWDGQTALKLGLVDDLGQLEDAINWVRTKVDDGDDCDVAAYPQLEPSFWDIVRISGLSGAQTQLMQGVLSQGLEGQAAAEALNCLRRKPLQARILPITPL